MGRAGLALAIILSGCTATAPAVNEATAEATTKPTTQAPDTPTEAAMGTRENPAPVGSTAELHEWDVTVTSVDPDAADRIDPDYAANGTPDADRRYILWEVLATYTGEDSGDVNFGLDWAVVGGKGNTFDFSDRCGAIRGQLATANEVFTGGTVSGPVCRKIPEDQVDGATIMLEESLRPISGYRLFYEIP